jgi:hypothetical protein
MERLDSQQKRKLSRILGAPTTMEEATECFSAWEMKVTIEEVTEYFADLQDKLEEELIIAERNQNHWRIRDLRRRMWWRYIVPSDVAKETEPAKRERSTSAYTPTTPEDRLRAENRQLAEQLSYYRGFADASRLFASAQKGAK